MRANPPQHNRCKTCKPDDSQSHKPPPRQLQNHARYFDTKRPIETKIQIIGQHPQDGANRWPQAAAQQRQKRHQARRIQTQLEQNRKADGKQIFRHAPQPKHAPEQQRPNSHHCRQQAHWEKRCITQLFGLYFRVAFPLPMHMQAPGQCRCHNQGKPSSQDGLYAHNCPLSSRSRSCRSSSSSRPLSHSADAKAERLPPQTLSMNRRL